MNHVQNYNYKYVLFLCVHNARPGSRNKTYLSVTVTPPHMLLYHLHALTRPPRVDRGLREVVVEEEVAVVVKVEVGSKRITRQLLPIGLTSYI